MTDTAYNALLGLANQPPAYGIAASLVLFWLCSAVRDKKTRIWGQHVAIIAAVSCMGWWAIQQAVETTQQTFNCFGAL